MVVGIITLVLGTLFFVMLSQPVFGMYSGDNMINNTIKDLFGKINDKTGYNILTFEKGQSSLLTAGNIFLIFAIVMCLVMMLCTIFNLISRASGSKQKIGAKIAGLLFFLSILIATILYVFYCKEVLGDSEKYLKEAGITITVGYGILTCLASGIFAFIFAPLKRKKSKK